MGSGKFSLRVCSNSENFGAEIGILCENISHKNKKNYKLLADQMTNRVINQYHMLETI